MTNEEARQVVQRIEKSKNDDELAHFLEDELREAVLEVIAAANLGEWSELAQIALSTKQIDFSRWCA